MTSWRRLTTFGAGLVMSSLAVAAIASLAGALGRLAPAEYRPDTMTDAAGVWWMAAVAIALVYLLVRRREFFGRLAGPEIGAERPAALVGPSTRSGVWMAVRAGLRGGSLLLLGWYVMGIAAVAEIVELPWPGDVFSSVWSTIWVLLPLLALVLLWRSVSGLRASLGAVALSLLCVCGAGLAVVIFLVAPEIADSGLWPIG